MGLSDGECGQATLLGQPCFGSGTEVCIVSHPHLWTEPRQRGGLAAERLFHGQCFWKLRSLRVGNWISLERMDHLRLLGEKHQACLALPCGGSRPPMLYRTELFTLLQSLPSPTISHPTCPGQMVGPCPWVLWQGHTYPPSRQEAQGSCSCPGGCYWVAEVCHSPAVGAVVLVGQWELALGVLYPPGRAHGP